MVILVSLRLFQESQTLGDFKKAIDYHELKCVLKIAKEVGDRSGEGKAYCNLGIAYDSLGDFKKAIDYHERDLKIAKEVGDRSGEGILVSLLAYGRLLVVGDRTGEGNAYYRL